MYQPTSLPTFQATNLPTSHDDFENVRDWWLAAEQQAICPNLSKMALKLLFIPVMSAELERLFSSCKITITDRRNELLVKVIKALGMSAVLV